MAPRKPQLATAAAASTSSSFPTWDQLVAEATLDKPPYQLPLPATEVDGRKHRETVLEIDVPDGDRYLDLSAAQRRGDAIGVLQALFPDLADQARVRAAMRGVHFPIVDVLAGKVLSHFFGLSIVSEQTSGNSTAS